MELNEKHIATIDNLLKFLLRCQLPEANGEEYLAFAQSYYFLYDLKSSITKAVEEKQRQQVALQQMASTPPTNTTSKGKKAKKKQ